MRTPSGLLHVVDFKTDQILSAIQPKDYWEDKRHWEIKNNIDMLEFKTFDGTPHAITLQQQNLVLKEVRDGRIVPYVINNEVEKDSNDRSLTVHSSGAWVQIAKDGIIKPQRIESETVNTFIDIALADSKWQRGITDYSSFHTMTIDEFIDPLTFLKKIAALFELEIQYRVEVSGSRITGWYVDMINKRGRETGKEVSLGKDLVGVRRIEHSRDICTALVGFVRGEGDELITVESINNGLLYITDNDAFQRWNAHGKHKFGFYTPETEDQNMTPQRLLTLMKTELKKRVNSSVSYEVEAQSIGRIFGLAHELINEGDTIRIKDTGFTPKLYLEARAIAGDESYTDPSQDKYVFGDYREIIDSNEELRKLYNKMRAWLEGKANKELLEQLEKLAGEAKKESGKAVKESQEAKDISEQLKKNIENNMVNIIEGKEPPTTDLKPNKTLWRDISNGKPGILKIWTGTTWESVVPDVEELKNELERTKDSLSSKISEKQMKAYVGGLGGLNVLFNTEFKDKKVDANGNVINETPSLTKWTKQGVVTGATLDVVTDRKCDGYNAVRINVSGLNSDSYTGIYQSVGVPLDSGDYVYSTWVYTADKNTITNGAVIKIGFYNGATQVSSVQVEIKDSLINGAWALVSVTAKAPATGFTSLRGDVWLRRNGTIWVSKPQLQQGKEPSVYMPNPKDITNYKELVDLVADKVAKSDFDTVTTNMQTEIRQNTEEIGFRAKATEVYSKTDADKKFAYVLEMEAAFNLTNQNINSRVKKGDVISQINQSAEEILIQGSRINLIGYVTAEHIKGKVLEGVTLKTSGNRFVEINKQDMKIFDADKPRGYIGFMETNDGSIQPSLVLGSDNIKYRGTGSFYIYQVMPRINGVDQPSKAYAKFGVSKGENAEGTNIWSNYIQMQNDGGHLSVYSDGQFRFKNLNDIIFESEGWAPGYGYFSVTTTEPHVFTNNWGQFTFKRKGSDYKIHFVNGATDHDLIMGNAMIRSSFVQGYNNGLQIKDMMGQGWKDIELRTLRAQENINANGQMWAKAFNPTSARNMKENIKDIPFSALEKIMNLTIKQYNFKDDMYDLYQMRVNKPEEQTEPYTTKDIETYFGMIADDTDDVFTDKEKKAINLYNTVSLFIAAFQQLYYEFIMLKEQVKQNVEELNVVKEENKQLKEQVTTLTDLVQKLISEKPEQP
ncbi:phage tail spike protein [Bacillus cereus]|uniref:phage tail spike protein n=1 Tax=Bacillus cereus TaxID=1396 RepID=UPI0025B0EED9|nr:phage tail spike protein [Bacillus cereus]WJX02821.1 phage tail spike protein [Bacillus cereus]